MAGGTAPETAAKASGAGNDGGRWRANPTALASRERGPKTRITAFLPSISRYGDGAAYDCSIPTTARPLRDSLVERAFPITCIVNYKALSPFFSPLEQERLSTALPYL